MQGTSPTFDAHPNLEKMFHVFRFVDFLGITHPSGYLFFDSHLARLMEIMVKPIRSFVRIMIIVALKLYFWNKSMTLTICKYVKTMGHVSEKTVLHVKFN